jgi:predicted transposase YbfD/YdcC
VDSTILRDHETSTAGGLVYDIDSLYAYLDRLPDPRQPKGVRYPLAVILVLILLAKLGGEDKPRGIAEWVAHRRETLVALLHLTRPSVPHYCTFLRVLKQLDPACFEDLVGAYQRRRLPPGSEVVISLDGKTLRGTLATGDLRGVHLLAAYLPGAGLVLMEAAVESGENEIAAAPALLARLDLDRAIVLGDALHTQRARSSQIVQAGGDFVWTVKGNQAHTEWAIQKLFVHEVANLNRGVPLSPDFQRTSHTSKGHGRIEKRTVMVSQLLNDYLDWPHLAQVFRVEREVWHPQGKTRRVVYGLTSLSSQKASPKRLLQLVRGYWGIENGLHYRRDVTLREDATRTTVGHTGHNLAILNNLVIALCLSHGYRNVAQARRLFAAKPENALELILRA